jgi:uncharacterized protein YyaL (SSP411 family)
MTGERRAPVKRLITILVCSIVLVSHHALASDFRFSPRPNKAHLVQWRDWGTGALEEAKKKNRLVLLSLSAVWCHWCHVMDETTYSNDEIIAYINEHFIPVRVDADLRPDIDTLYNQGGWPSTAILTPQGEVISGGNYIPPEEMLARLKRAAALFSNDRTTIVDRLKELKAMKELDHVREAGRTGLPDKGELDKIAEVLKNSFDSIHGGFGRNQKFPNPDAIDFLLSRYARDKDESLKKIITKTLDAMAKGEIFDRIEGGFFRYATKPDWSEPHFEKMLEVNAGMIKNYADASLAFRSKGYLAVVRESIRFVQARLYDPASGALYGSQDADESYYKKQDRKGLRPPFIDTTSYADSSSLMISAFVAAYNATGETGYLDMAIKGAEFLLRNMSAGSDGIFHAFHSGTPSLKGLLSDNALFGSAMLDLYNITGDRRYLRTAQEIGGLVIGSYYDGATKRLRFTLDTSLIKPVTAGVLSEMNENLANYRAVRFLSRLAFTGEYGKLKKVRDDVAAGLSGEYERFAPYAGTYGTALLWMVGDPVQITILADGEGVRNYLSIINRLSVPEKAVRVLSLLEDVKEIKKLNYPLQQAAYLCVGKRCSAPIISAEDLKAGLKDLIAKPSRE